MRRPLMISTHARKECLTLAAIGVLLAVSFTLLGFWYLGAAAVLLAAGGVAFFRDPERRTPTQRGVVVAPADGRVSSIHRIERYEPLGGPAVCIRIFLSVLDVHINRSPCHGTVASVSPRPGKYLNALNPESAEVNASNTVVLVHPIRRHPVAAVRQVAGAFARTIVCTARPGHTLQRGERMGLIKLGSTTELYLPEELKPRVQVEVGQKVYGGLTVVARVTAKEPDREQTPRVSPPRGTADATDPSVTAAPTTTVGEVTAAQPDTDRGERRGREPAPPPVPHRA